MRESLSTRERVRHSLRSAALVAGHLAEKAVRRGLSLVQARFAEDSLLRQQSRRMVDQVSRGADAVIEKSPVPIPQTVQLTMGKMQAGLGQLSHAQDLTDLEAWESRTGSHTAAPQYDTKRGGRDLRKEGLGLGKSGGRHLDAN